ncbi:hypothetical protein Amet_3977 [Alkaliphilus metalliredigens QYMF]|uniref:ABC-three component systems C-terminal domain-containing protein n=1 Tax=Alkaliphilus metalliredigens (strain QYMF) TaxID=293826 RepID=A6TV44_ALKMQ|nr:ABC-three component system protein [Alkaliphilus metalliredigens]ABR50062.1 hypothetical protein Amet_3977 [Alkaliphilus metalliredigens QYMF]
MLKKLRLDQTKIYELTIATYEISTMLVDFVRGRKHYLSIGAEQGDVDTWDDLIIEKEKDLLVHIQVKRQKTNFSNDNCIRDKITKQERKGQPKDLSSIDKSMKSLAEWIKNNNNDLNKKEFHIELPNLEVQLKKGLIVGQFKDLIEQHYKPNITTTQGLSNLASKDSSVKNCYNWLNSWCDFEDWDHILNLLSIIKIKDSGLETDIKLKTEDKLKDIFISDKVKEVRERILSYIHINTTFTGAVSPRCLLFELKSYLQPNISLWTQFEKQDSKWCVSGTNDIELNTEIERPNFVIPKLWNGTLLQNLKINAELSDRCGVSDSLLRLAIHQTGNSNTHCVNSAVIRSRINDKIGGTLGLEINDVQTLSIVENNENFRCEEIKQLSSRAENRNYSDNMEKTMHLETWNKVSINIEELISGMYNIHSTTLQDQLEARWEIWKKKLNNDAQGIGELLKSIVHPRAEGESINGMLRVGMRTAQLLAESLFNLLIISIALDPENNGDWKKINDKLAPVAVGLRYWSGEAGKQRKVKAIDEDGNIIIGKETANALIFSKVTSPPNEMWNDLISYSKDQVQNSIADGKTPDLIITNCVEFRKLINKGDIEAVRNYVKSQLRDSESINLTNIKEITG